MLVYMYLRGTPIWRTENSVNIRNLLWLSRPLIITTEKTSIYISTFPNALTSKRAQNYEMSIYFSTNSIAVFHSRISIYNPKFQNALVRKRSTLLSCKIVSRYKYAASYVW